MARTNCLVELARADGRDYITPEDVTEAFQTNSLTRVRLAVLEVLGRQVPGVGAEDASLCAYAAFRGRRR